MANNFLTAKKIAATGLGLLQREIVLPALVWRDAGGSFKGAAGDTITLRVPARTQARTRNLRGARGTASEGNGIITMDELTETSIDVTLDEAIYNAIPATDEELTLDIVSFADQVLGPQVRAVAEGMENKLAAEMVGATYANTVPVTAEGETSGVATGGVYRAMVKARRYLNDANVPMNDRIVVMGSGMEELFLNDAHLHEFDRSGSDSALRDATIGRIAGFNQVVVSNALPADFGVAFHRTAFVLSLMAPAIPQGASFGTSQSYQGLAMRYLRDYDFRNVQDRSLVDVYAGSNIVADGQSSEVQTVTLTGATGGTFTLTYNGRTTDSLAYNASAAAVKSALNAMPGVAVDVSGLPGGPYTVTFSDSGNVAAMTVAAGSLTGSGTPTAAVATSTEGDMTFVRAVALDMS